MRAEELRIGNCVHFDMNNPREDNEPEQGYVDHIITAKDLNDKETIERLTPIPLTEEWLVKMGFRKSDREFILILNSYGDLTFAGNEMYLSFGQFSEMSNTVPCKHVHQLQNLYWCLCGEELKLNN